MQGGHLSALILFLAWQLMSQQKMTGCQKSRDVIMYIDWSSIEPRPESRQTGANHQDFHHSYFSTICQQFTLHAEGKLQAERGEFLAVELIVENQGMIAENEGEKPTSPNEVVLAYLPDCRMDSSDQINCHETFNDFAGV